MRAVVVGGSALVVAASPWLKPVLPWPAALRPLVNAETPVDVVTYLERASPRPQRLFHSEATGSYLMWAAPHQRVFIDTRVELYPAGQWQDYLWLGVGFEADSLLDRYGIDGLLLDKQRQAGLVAWARQAAMWRVTRETERHALFTPMVP